MKWLGQVQPRLVGATTPSAQIVLIHGGASTAPKLAAALPGADVAIVYREGSSSGYDEKTGLAKDYPKLTTLLADVAPSWKPGVPLVILAFSAGGWALRYYLRDPAARSLITSAVFLDSLYGAPGGVCDLAPYQGIIAYGKEPGKLLVMTYSQGHPAPGICSQAIAKAVGSNAVVKGYANADHSAQQGVVGPEVVKQYVAPFLKGVPSSTTLATSSGSAPETWKLVVGGLLAAAVVGAVVMWRPKELSANPLPPAELPKELVITGRFTKPVSISLDWRRFPSHPESGVVFIKAPASLMTYEVEQFMKQEMRKIGLVPGKKIDQFDIFMGDVSYSMTFSDRRKRVVRNDLTEQQRQDLEKLLLEILNEAYTYWRRTAQSMKEEGYGHYAPKEPEFSTTDLALNVAENYCFKPLDSLGRKRAVEIVRSTLERMQTRGMVEGVTGIRRGKEVRLWAPKQQALRANPSVSIRKAVAAGTSFGDRSRTIKSSAKYGVYLGDKLVAYIYNAGSGDYRSVASWRVVEPDLVRERSMGATYRTLEEAKAYVESPAFLEVVASWKPFPAKQLLSNPRVKPWVEVLLRHRAELERAAGGALGQILGCGHWGCVIDMPGTPWVLKLTVDPTEAHVWAKILELIEQQHYGDDGFPRFKKLFKLDPGIPYGIRGRKRIAYGIVREKVMPVFRDSRFGAVLTEHSKQELGLGHITEPVTVTGLKNKAYEGLSQQAQYRADEFVENIEMVQRYREAAWYWHAKVGFSFSRYRTREAALEDAENSIHRMGGPTGGPLGESLQMLLASGPILLNDVHLLNLGWRFLREVEGQEGYPCLVIFDPGHTPTAKQQLPTEKWVQLSVMG